MKILILAPNSEVAASVVQAAETAGHVVVDCLLSASSVVQTIVRDEPQLLFAVGHWPGDVFDGDVLADFTRLFPDLTVRAVSPEEDWHSALIEQLSRKVLQSTPRSYAEGTRLVFHDDELAVYNKGKLRRPIQAPGWEAECSRQEGYFLLQLETGKRNHAFAKSYYECMIAQQEGLDREVAYRLCHGSYKGLAWTRDWAARWCALLAHYVSGVELDYLPSPHPVCPDADHVHHVLPAWGHMPWALSRLVARGRLFGNLLLRSQQRILTANPMISCLR